METEKSSVRFEVFDFESRKVMNQIIYWCGWGVTASGAIALTVLIFGTVVFVSYYIGKVVFNLAAETISSPAVLRHMRRSYRPFMRYMLHRWNDADFSESEKSEIEPILRKYWKEDLGEFGRSSAGRAKLSARL